MNIDGMSEATIEKFIARGFLHELADLFKLERYKDEIIQWKALVKSPMKSL